MLQDHAYRQDKVIEAHKRKIQEQEMEIKILNEKLFKQRHESLTKERYLMAENKSYEVLNKTLEK